MGWFRRNEHDEEQLSAYLDGELNSRQTENVEKHLSTCDACAALLNELRDTRAMLSALPVPTPRRSFVLGAEYARAPAREGAAPLRRFNLALAPAVALSVFVALVFVDLSGVSRGGDSDDAFTMANSRQAEDAASTAGSAAMAPMIAEDADGFEALGDKAVEGEPQPAAASGTLEAAGGAAGLDEAVPPELRSSEAPGEGDTAITALGQEPAEAPSPDMVQPFDAAEDDDAISTLRVLQVLAGAAFLASGIYVFVWPRVSRGGSST